MKLANVSFKYETADKAILTDASVRLTLASRVALVGLNGAGALAAALFQLCSDARSPRQDDAAEAAGGRPAAHAGHR